MIEIVHAGPLTTIQDLGRPHLAGIGAGTSGAADVRSFTLANRLVGNTEAAAGLELTLGGLTARFTRHALIAVTGAPCPLHRDGRVVDMYGPIAVAPGQQLHVGSPARGLRTYVAVRGGIDVPPVLGARATDQLAELGPPPVRPGRTLATGADAVARPVIDHAPQPPYPSTPELRVIPGPRHDWFTGDTLDMLCSSPFHVTPQSNRIGLRLSGPPLTRSVHDELAPEPLVPGALQVPPDGRPVLFLADHPVTGGYPVVGVVAHADLHLAAQARPGQSIRFRIARSRELDTRQAHIPGASRSPGPRP